MLYRYNVVYIYYHIFQETEVDNSQESKHSSSEEISLVLNQMASVQDITPILSVIPEVKEKESKFHIFTAYLCKYNLIYFYCITVTTRITGAIASFTS